MRKILFLLTVFVGIVSVSAQSGESFKAPTKFTNIAFVNTTMKQSGFPDLKSNWGVSLTNGHSYYLHKPINGRLRFGIDVAWIDVNYQNYKVEMLTWEGFQEDFTIQEVELGLQLGAGAHYSFNNRMGVHASVRYNPCYSMLYRGDDFQGSFGNFLVAGVSVHYRFIGLGIEGRFGKAKYKSYLDPDNEDDDSDGSGYDAPAHGAAAGKDGKISSKFAGFRAYVSFAF